MTMDNSDNTNENIADNGDESIQIDDLDNTSANVAEAEDLPDMSDYGITSGKRKDEKDVQAIYDIPVQISAVLGKALNMLFLNIVHRPYELQSFEVC